MDLHLSDKVALVTAASRGLGKAAARQFAREGARVVMCARSEILENSAAEIQQENDQRKNYIANDERFKTIMIRIKKINGFNRNTIHIFQREIMRQFFDQTGIKLPYSSALEYDPYTNCLKLRKGPLDRF